MKSCATRGNATDVREHLRVLEVRLDTPQPAHIAKPADETDRTPGFVVIHSGTHNDLSDGPIAPHDAVLEVHGVGRSSGREQSRVHTGPVVRMDVVEPYFRSRWAIDALELQQRETSARKAHNAGLELPFPVSVPRGVLPPGPLFLGATGSGLATEQNGGALCEQCHELLGFLVVIEARAHGGGPTDHPVLRLNGDRDDLAVGPPAARADLRGVAVEVDARRRHRKLGEQAGTGLW